jgi:plasmid rolling circle replication initiator protein Rep
MSILSDTQKKINIDKLVDKSGTGKDRPWQIHKKKSTLLSQSYTRIGKEKRGTRVNDCGDFLKFAACPQGHEKFLRRANFCGVRLCPMCGWRRSLKAAHQVKKVAHQATKQMKVRWLFLTLTCKNVEGYELPDAMDVLSRSWKRLTETKTFRGNVLGFFRATEVTRNNDLLSKSFNTYHPHFHVILAVQPSYFSGKKYMKTDEWVQMWRKAMRADYDPIVDIRVVKTKRDLKMEEKILQEKGVREIVEGLPGEAVAELAKYATKADDFIIADNKIDTDEAVQILDVSLKGRKLFAYGGVLKDIYDFMRKNGDVTDVEDEGADLIHTEEKEEKNCKCSVCQSNFLEEVYRWLPERKSYFLDYRDEQ